MTARQTRFTKLYSCPLSIVWSLVAICTTRTFLHISWICTHLCMRALFAHNFSNITGWLAGLSCIVLITVSALPFHIVSTPASTRSLGGAFGSAYFSLSLHAFVFFKFSPACITFPFFLPLYLGSHRHFPACLVLCTAFSLKMSWTTARFPAASAFWRKVCIRPFVAFVLAYRYRVFTTPDSQEWFMMVRNNDRIFGELDASVLANGHRAQEHRVKYWEKTIRELKREAMTFSEMVVASRWDDPQRFAHISGLRLTDDGMQMAPSLSGAYTTFALTIPAITTIARTVLC